MKEELLELRVDELSILDIAELRLDTLVALDVTEVTLPGVLLLEDPPPLPHPVKNKIVVIAGNSRNLLSIFILMIRKIYELIQVRNYRDTYKII